MNSLMKLAVVATTVCTAYVSTAARAVTMGELLRLDMALDDSSKPDGLRKLGSVRSYMGKLKQASRHCRIEGHEHGVQIVCEEPETPTVLIELSAEPTRRPEFARVTSIRPNGADGGELPVAEFSRFLDEFAPAPDKR